MKVPSLERIFRVILRKHIETISAEFETPLNYNQSRRDFVSQVMARLSQ